MAEGRGKAKAILGNATACSRARLGSPCEIHATVTERRTVRKRFRSCPEAAAFQDARRVAII